MPELLKQHVIQSCRYLLRPLVRFLLRHGVSWDEFGELSKDAYVYVAREEHGIQGRPTNNSRVAILTGLSRREVARVRDRLLLGEDGDDSVHGNRLSRILSGWHSDGDFTGPDGRPTDLPADGAETSFEDLLRRYAGDLPHGAVRKEMLQRGLIEELNDLYTMFDSNAEKYGCERIKTIGDAYLCVCGMPEPHPDHAHRLLRAARAILADLKERNHTSEIQWEARIGIHSGPVVGGVVGVKKYIYDVFGDTINVTSRMESHCEPMRINVSEATYELVKESFEFEERGAIDVKGRGPMAMYYLA